MKTLNLVNPDKSDIKYKISKFPDGQQNVVIPDQHPKIGTYDSMWQSVHIKSRLNTFQDLELIICATKCLRGIGIKKIHLYTPYFMGARSDRKFEEGGNNYLKDVICPIINSLNFESVQVLDPHSHVLEACLNNFKSTDNEELVSWAIGQNICKGEGFKNTLKNCILVSPDAGASHKIYKLAEKIGYKGDIITCSKERDTDGKLTRTVVPRTPNYNHEYWTKDFIIIDDICDGGRTFINIAERLREAHIIGSKSTNVPHGKIYLIVTHGIFSKGFEELNKYFDGIYCTNSYQDIDDDMLEKYEGEYDQYDVEVKQLNVF